MLRCRGLRAGDEGGEVAGGGAGVLEEEERRAEAGGLEHLVEMGAWSGEAGVRDQLPCTVLTGAMWRVGPIGKTRGRGTRGAGEEPVRQGGGEGQKETGGQWAARGTPLHPGRAGLSKELAHSVSEQSLGPSTRQPCSRSWKQHWTDRLSLPSGGW